MKSAFKKKLALNKETLRVVAGATTTLLPLDPPKPAAPGFMMQDTKLMVTCSSCAQ